MEMRVIKYRNFETKEKQKFILKMGEFDKGYGFNIFGPDGSHLSGGERETEDQVVQIFDTVIAQYKLSREGKRQNGIPSSIEFCDALNKFKLSKSLKDMFKDHYHAPDRKMTSSQLALSGGYKDFTAANGQYGRFGKLVCDYLDFTPPGKYQDGSPLWITAITESNHNSFQEDTGHYQHILRDEFADALKAMGLA